MTSINRERAERIAKAHACENCGEYSYKRVSVKAATESQRQELEVAWVAQQVCGVCNAHQELGIADDGDIIYAA